MSGGRRKPELSRRVPDRPKQPPANDTPSWKRQSNDLVDGTPQLKRERELPPMEISASCTIFLAALAVLGLILECR
jgi:hypothetical protein